MNPSDDLLTRALAFVEQPEASDLTKSALLNVGRAPLADLIDGMLKETPATSLRSSLRKIATLNQGSISDLDDQEFRSYITRKLVMPATQLHACIGAIKTYLKVKEAAATDQGTVLMAARTEDGTIRGKASASDILRELRRRV